jgi:putative membrane protein
MAAEIRSEANSPSSSPLVFLAAERTRLANHRTFLAYQRTALTLFVAGVTFIRFFDNLLIEIIGWAFLPTALMTILIGAIRYRRTRDRIQHTMD